MKAECGGDIHHKLCYAINKRLKAEVTYKKDKDTRVIEPHDYGILEGETIRKLLAYQLKGHSRRGGLPDWREFEVAGIRKITVLSERFLGTRPALMHRKWRRVFASVSLRNEKRDVMKTPIEQVENIASAAGRQREEGYA
jgi:hypothetical protein